ncbi:hypothetical protein ACFE04_015944 [Oxalis oulophora]
MSSTRMIMFKVNCSVQKPSISQDLKIAFSSVFKIELIDQPMTQRIEPLPMQINVQEFVKNNSVKLLNAFVDSVFEFIDQPLLPSQSNFAPIKELGDTTVVTVIEGEIPDGFPEGVYVRNGPNPLHGGLKSAKSIFGKSAPIWVEGEGMLHAMYFNQESDGNWTVVYNNRHVETDTYLWEKQRSKPGIIPVALGDPPAILIGVLLNFMRFGQPYKNTSNINFFEHGGKFYSIAENNRPQEIDISTLDNKFTWDVNGAWNRCFTSHPKKVPGTGELVISGQGATKPYYQLGVISADGKELKHKVDLKLDRCTFTHDLGVTERYMVFMDFPLTIDLYRLFKGGPSCTVWGPMFNPVQSSFGLNVSNLLGKQRGQDYNKEDYARIGVIPRYGDSDSIRWFDVEPNCTLHIVNCFEEDDEVVVWGCRARESVLKKPEGGSNKFERLAKRLASMDDQASLEKIMEDEKLFTRCYEWRLNMRTGEVKERYLTGYKHCMDFPAINEKFTGVKNKYGYAQVVDVIECTMSGLPKFGGIVKLCFDESDNKNNLIKVEHHKFDDKTYGTGISFVPKEQGLDEDDGWIITFIHNEDTNISQVHVIDAKKFSEEPVAKITLPCRVPYGFHGAFMAIKSKQYILDI